MSASSWFLLQSGPGQYAFNMALDEALMSRARQTGEWTLRVYSWSRPTISFGRNEAARRHYDADRIRARRFSVVRRPTGGRAILHDREITYCVTAPVLIVIGKKDIQVDWLTDGPLFESIARDHDNLTIRYSENANHVLKYEPRDRTQISAADAMLTYSAADTQLDRETVETITTWLDAHLKTAVPASP